MLSSSFPFGEARCSTTRKPRTSLRFEQAKRKTPSDWCGLDGKRAHNRCRATKQQDKQADCSAETAVQTAGRVETGRIKRPHSPGRDGINIPSADHTVPTMCPSESGLAASMAWETGCPCQGDPEDGGASESIGVLPELPPRLPSLPDGRFACIARARRVAQWRLEAPLFRPNGCLSRFDPQPNCSENRLSPAWVIPAPQSSAWPGSLCPRCP